MRDNGRKMAEFGGLVFAAGGAPCCLCKKNIYIKQYVDPDI